MAETKLRVGVIGLGMGRHHIKGYQEHPLAEVVAIADLDETRLKSVGEEYGIPNRFSAPQEMLDTCKLDVVSVATPNKFHRPLTLAALKAGCHVLCEKPMAMNAAEAREMQACADKVGKRIMINFSYRFREQSWALKQQVESGILGEIYYARTCWTRRRGMPKFGGWFGQKELAGGGPLIDLGVHRLDLALWLMGYPKPTWAMARTYNPIATERAAREGKQFDVEDLAVGMLTFENGASLSLEAGWAANQKEREFMYTQVLGTKAGLRQFNLNETYDFEAEIYLEREGCQFDLRLKPPVPGARGAMYHFIESIVTEQPHTATGAEGVLVMDILDALYESAATGQPVKIQA